MFKRSEKKEIDNEKRAEVVEELEVDSISDATSDLNQGDGRFVAGGHTKRRLKGRHIDLIAIGGSIGTALFVTIGNGLMKGGCGNLLVSFTIHAFFMYLVTLTIGELICFLPVDSPFISHAGRFVDPAFEFMMGYNFYIMVSLYLPFEITSFNSMIHFWAEGYSPAAAFAPQIVAYLALNIFAVKAYGESEFYLSMGKLILAFGLIFFTFVTMVGGNPQHDAFGFRNFKGVHNAFPQYLGSGASAFWAAYLKAIFTEAAPEYLGMVAGEAENPRVTMPRAFKTIIYRLLGFFVLGSLSVGIILKHDNAKLVEAITQGASGANVSPYVIAMQNMKIKALPDIVNVLCMTSTFSAGNSYMYCSTRALFALAKRGLAPKFFTYTTKNGVPIAALVMAVCFSCLSLLQLGSAASVALDWMVNLVTGAQINNYVFMMITYLGFYRACNAQGLDRSTLPLQSWCTKLQPWPAYYCIFTGSIIIMFLGASAFIPTFSVDDFLYYYLFFFIDVALFLFWKIVKRTKFVDPKTADLVSYLDVLDAHEREYYAAKGLEGPPKELKWYQKIVSWAL